MTIPFAPPASGTRARTSVLACRPIARALAARALERAANENFLSSECAGPGTTNEQILHAALRHFARHGLGAARAARGQAEAALLAGDRQGYAWWLGITRTLDRRLAAQIERNVRPPA